MKYYINGFREGEAYFTTLGKFSESEWKDLLDGKVIVKNNNEFYIMKGE